MEFQAIRPILSGLAGGIIAIYFCRAMARWVPATCNGKPASYLLAQYQVANWLANACFFAGIIAGVAAYKMGFFQDNDWHGLAVSSGASAFAAIAVLPVVALARRGNAKEAFVAYAVYQKCPIVLLYGILTVFIACGLAAVVDLFGAGR